MSLCLFLLQRLYHTEHNTPPKDAEACSMEILISNYIHRVSRNLHTHTFDELQYGARVAWRNAAKCANRKVILLLCMFKDGAAAAQQPICAYIPARDQHSKLSQSRVDSHTHTHLWHVMHALVLLSLLHIYNCVICCYLSHHAHAAAVLGCDTAAGHASCQEHRRNV